MDNPELIEQLKRAQTLGFLGPVPVQDHIAHSAGFLEALEGLEHGRVADLGSGGGVPGLIVASARPDLHLVLIDATAKRCRFLEEAVAALDLDAEVVEGRAEVLGRGALRATFDAVLARSFGPPAATAECGSPLLHVGGELMVSEPPQDDQRWPAEVSQLGLEVGRRVGSTPVVQTLRQATLCPERFPRRDGLPAKRPLF